MVTDHQLFTQEVDIARFERLSLALDDTVGDRLEGVFDGLKFTPVPSLEKGRVWRWQQTQRQTLVEFLTPSFDDTEGVRRINRSLARLLDSRAVLAGLI